MYSQRVKSIMEPHKLLTAGPEATVRAAARLMAERNAGAVLVLASGALRGILTERDIAFRVVARGLDPDAVRLGEVMTPAPVTIEADDSYGYGLLLMHEHGFRHLPVMQDGRLAGIVSARYALDPELEEFVAETRRRTAIQQRQAHAS